MFTQYATGSTLHHSSHRRLCQATVCPAGPDSDAPGLAISVIMAKGLLEGCKEGEASSCTKDAQGHITAQVRYERDQK